MTIPKPPKNDKGKPNLHLILNSYMMEQFGFKDFDEIQSKYNFQNVHEGFDEEGRGWMFYVLFPLKGVDEGLRSKLEEYDANIKAYMDHINANRDRPIQLKYFQYMAVLFTEIFLDRYFTDRVAFTNELTDYAMRVTGDDFGFVFTPEDMRKLAYLMATGSGKTIILHINYLQFLHYNQGPDRIELDNIILITPNESMSQQHIDDMQADNIPCELFTNESGYFSEFEGLGAIKVLDIRKLVSEKKGQGVTIDVESFGSKNLLFVDEGHKGIGGDKWVRFRDQVSANGFTFEYSATFIQAVAASPAAEARELSYTYGKATIFDYSYWYFYNDGYGKDYRILNLKDAAYEKTKKVLMLANLLSYYEQKLIFDEKYDMAREYNIEDPLWIFIGSKVQSKEQQSDILEIVKFLDDFLSNQNDWVLDDIKRIFEGKSGLVDEHDHDMFSPTYPEQRLKYIRDRGRDLRGLYHDILKRIFHSAGSAPLSLIRIKNAEGEIALQCGAGDYFGVINIGDDVEFIKLVNKKASDISTSIDEVGESLFRGINKPASKLNLLVGAKKFIEGWNSWRVSNMGLLNIGRSEGPQIIQLFGRGVRLKGKQNSLKRSGAVDPSSPAFLRMLETLNIFAIKANYMEQFKDTIDPDKKHLHDRVEVTVPIRVSGEHLNEKLLVPYADKFRYTKERLFALQRDDRIHVDLDLRPRFDIIKSTKEELEADTKENTRTIEPRLIEAVDWTRIYLDMLEYKALKSWGNITFTREALKGIMSDGKCYDLKCPEYFVKPRTFEDLGTVERIMTTILKKYVEKYYERQKNVWTRENLNIKHVEATDPNFDVSYIIQVDEGQSNMVEAIESLKDHLEEFYMGLFKDKRYITNVYFDRHLYQPLIAKNIETDKIKIQPKELNAGERKLVENLKDYVDANPELFINCKIFVLRNLPKRGIGFFETTNFYPDFIIWVKGENMQNIIFVDPKGLAHVRNGFNDDKIQLSQTIKEDEHKLREKFKGEKITLDSYIVSVTKEKNTDAIFGYPAPTKYDAYHILFQDDDKYIEKLLHNAIMDCGTVSKE